MKPESSLTYTEESATGHWSSTRWIQFTSTLFPQLQFSIIPSTPRSSEWSPPL